MFSSFHCMQPSHSILGTLIINAEVERWGGGGVQLGRGNAAGGGGGGRETICARDESE